MKTTSWPKIMPTLTPEEQEIRANFMKTWLSIAPHKYSVFEKFSHESTSKGHALPKRCKTLEIGAGIGEHIRYENIENQEYYALEIRKDFTDQIKRDFPSVKPVCGDIQTGVHFPDHYFDRIIAIHVLEHLPNLPAALKEIKRLIKPSGICEFMLPCEGSLAYSFAREISAKRLFKKIYPGVSYDIYIKSEHVNTYYEVYQEIKDAGFNIEKTAYFPIPAPFIFCNLAVGLRCRAA
jgi:SAM-dependent methyltransferase